MALDGHASQAAIYRTVVALTILSGFAVVIRVYTRLAIVRQSGWDDVFIAIAWVSAA